MNLVPVYEKGLLLFRDYVVRAPNISGRFKHIMLDNVRRYVFLPAPLDCALDASSRQRSSPPSFLCLSCACFPQRAR